MDVTRQVIYVHQFTKNKLPSGFIIPLWTAAGFAMCGLKFVC